MEEAGVVHRCACCSNLPSPDIKLLSCPCKEVRYCSKACQTAHWKSTHKKECAMRANKPDGTSTSSSGGSGSGTGSGAPRRQTAVAKRKPSETAIDAAMRDITSGKDNGRPPMPGTEASEAWKECVRRMMLSLAVSGDTHSMQITQSTLDNHEAAEVAFFNQFPDAPDWAKYKK